ncbi:MAG: hypothetical protein K0S01_2041 [Herbinix sp.]|jgi:hypothetical protein|nr:hypothetical protein [Herbinix sp.]
MSRLDPEKLTVEFKEGVTTTEPIIPRRYTLTHSDITAELFLMIGLEYAYDKINYLRDEVRGEWIKKENGYLYYVYLYIDGHFGPTTISTRDFIFRRELPLALEAIRYGDREFFNAHPELDNSPIMVFFQSADPQYNKVENWGIFSDYDIRSTYTEDGISTTEIGRYLIDVKVGDVTGDGVADKVSLYGSKPEEPSEIFVENITVEIEDGHSKESESITPEYNSGYNPTIFLGDFTKDNSEDIKISIDSGGSGGYGYFYIYSFKDNKLQEIFDFDKYNEEYEYSVDYMDLYRVAVANDMLGKLFVLDISNKGSDYLSQYYDKKGKLMKPVQGEVLALSSLAPYVNDEKNNTYDLLAFQRIIGTTNSDTLGYIENLLTWDGQRFVTSRMLVSIPGMNLISTKKQ